MAINLDAEIAKIEGRYVDYDYAPKNAPYQCHDVWLWLLYLVGGQPGEGYAPDDATVSVFHRFPYRPRLAQLFTKHHGTAGIRKGDVLFWERNAWYPGSHTAVALGPVQGELVPCLTQNPGPVKRANLITRGLVGYLRPVALNQGGGSAPSPGGTDMAFESIRNAADGSITFADEYGIEGIDAYRSADIGGTEYLTTFSKVFGGWKDLTHREFDIARAIADRRRAAVEARLADRVTAQVLARLPKSGQVDTAAIAAALAPVAAQAALAAVQQGLAAGVAVDVDEAAVAKAVVSELATVIQAAAK